MAPKGNKNSEGHKSPTKGKRGQVAMMSMPHEEWEMFKAAAEISEGHSLNQDELIELWRAIDRAARRAFIDQWRAREMADPEVLII